MKEASPIFSRAGNLLLAIGLLDIGIMAASFASGLGAKSSLSIFAIFAGFKVRGGHRAIAKRARQCSWGTPLIAILLAFFLYWRGRDGLVDYMVEVHPVAGAYIVLASAAICVLGHRLYATLSSPEALAEVFDEKPAAPGRFPGRAIVAGLLIAALMLIEPPADFLSEERARAIELANRQVGPGYKFFAMSLRRTVRGDKVSGGAHVVAYKAGECKQLELSW